MKIESLSLEGFPPIRNLKINEMGSTVVIAGANGSGKTRLKQAIVQTVQGSPQMDMSIVATRDEEQEQKYFNGPRIEIKHGQQNEILKNYINSRKYGAGRYVGSLVQIDSDRSVNALKFNQVNWLGGDPDDVESISNFYFNAFSNRWQDFMNYIHQKSAARDKKLAEVMKQHPDLSGSEILKKYPDPLEKYQEIFSSILPGKTLLPIEPASPSQFRFKDETGNTLGFEALSSGEKEVIKVLFDVARKEIKHSIIIVDEPELHLHPTLTFKLIEALKNIGDHTNQYIFLTHSPDLISTYYSSGDVYFIDQVKDSDNQAHRLSDLEKDHHLVANLIGDNLGLFAVGKKLVFVEGEDSSIDRLTYQKIAQYINPEIRIIPAGSVFNILSLSEIESQIRKAIFGIDLYMIRDKDGLSEKQISDLESNGRIRCLKRRHIENYFLDPQLLFKVAEHLYITVNNPALNVAYIEVELAKIAKESIAYSLCKNAKEFIHLNYFLHAPSVKDIDNKTSSQIRSDLMSSLMLNKQNLMSQLDESQISDWLKDEEVQLNKELENGEWRYNFQGKYIFNQLCRKILKTEPMRVRQAYVDIALTKKPEIFEDVISIFQNM